MNSNYGYLSTISIVKPRLASIAVVGANGLLRSGSAEGPCLIHSMNGDLLRTLEGPAGCERPRLIQVSSEGHCVVYYERGHFCLFSINGKELALMEVEESVRVSACRGATRGGHQGAEGWNRGSDTRQTEVLRRV